MVKKTLTLAVNVVLGVVTAPLFVVMRVRGNREAFRTYGRCWAKTWASFAGESKYLARLPLLVANVALGLATLPLACGMGLACPRRWGLRGGGERFPAQGGGRRVSPRRPFGVQTRARGQDR